MDVSAFAMSLRDLDSSTLLERFGAAVRRDHRETAGLVCYIAEIDRRELWAERGFSSLFRASCT